MDKQIRHLHLFNCDETYKLDAVESLFLEMNGKLSFQFSIVKKYFALREMSEMCFTVPELQMDFAVFVVEANESRLSINEDNAGIGYARFYRALLRATGDKVLIVVGGDTNYKNEDEKDRRVVSRWVRNKLASQFAPDFLDGRKSFIFSWDKNHRPIHEEALLHYFDPGNAGTQFVPQPKVKPQSPPSFPSVVIIDPFPLKENSEKTPLLGGEGSSDASKSANQQHGTTDNKKASSESEDSENQQDYYPEGSVVLDTRMRYGKISYDDKDVVAWDVKGLPPDQIVQDLEREHKWMTSDENGKIQPCRIDLTPLCKQENSEKTLLLGGEGSTDASKFAVQQPDTTDNRKASSDSDSENRQQYYPEGSVVLDTRMRYGKISYDDKDVATWDGKWLPPDKTVRDLEQEHKWKAEARVWMTSDENGKIQRCRIDDLTPWWKQGFVSLRRCWMRNAVSGNASSDSDSENRQTYDTVVLDTRMRYGKISYENEDVVTWDGKWFPPDQIVRDLEQEHKWEAEARVWMTSNENGKIQCHTVDLAPWWKRLSNAVCGNGTDEINN